MAFVTKVALSLSYLQTSLSGSCSKITEFQRPVFCGTEWRGEKVAHVSDWELLVDSEPYGDSHSTTAISVLPVAPSNLSALRITIMQSCAASLSSGNQFLLFRGADVAVS